MMIGAALAQRRTQQPPAGRGGGRGAPSIQPKAEELAAIRAKSEQIEAAVKDLRAKHADPDLLGDVEVYAQSGPDAAGISRSCSTRRTRSIMRCWCSIRESSGPSSLRRGQLAVERREEADPRLLLGDRRVGAAVRDHAAGELRCRRSPRGCTCGCTAGRTTPPRSEFIFAQQTFRPGNAPVADQGQIQVDLFGRINGGGLALGRRGRCFRGDRGGEEALQDRRQARHAARLLDGRRRRVAYRAALSRPLRGGRDRRGHVVAAGADAGTAAVSIRRAEDLGKHGGVGAERVQSAAGRARRRYRYADRVAARSADRALRRAGNWSRSLRTRAQLEREGFASEGEPDFLRLERHARASS